MTMKKARVSRSPGASSSNTCTIRDPQALVEFGFHGTPELLEGRKKKDFFIKLSYENTLPDVPCDPKHIVLPLDPLKFQLPALAMQPFYEQLLDNTCGVTLDLVGSTLNWKLPSSVSLEPEDALLLQDETEKGEECKLKRSKTHSTSVTWLRRTEYISSEPAKFKTQHGDKLEYRMEKAIGKKVSDGEAKWGEFEYLRDRRARIQAIEQSFYDTLTPVTSHFSKPGVYAVEVVPVFPDFQLELRNVNHPFVEVVFDTSPSTSGNLGKIEEAQMKDALLMSLSTLEGEEEGVERIGYFVPTVNDNTSLDSDDFEGTATNEYSLARDYVFKQGSKNMSEIDDTYVFVEKEDQVSYCEIGKRTNLNRSIKTDSQTQTNLRGTKLLVSFKSSDSEEQEIDFWRQPEQTLILAHEVDSCDDL